MSSFRPDIEGVRALSIALVMVYHFRASWLPGGYVGVDVFFVISGYLITLSLLDAHRPEARLGRELLGFWARRARRLLPNALLLLATLALVGAILLPDTAGSRLGSDVAWAAGYAINWLFVVRSTEYLRWGETDASALLNYWSLAVEEQFYLAWPIVLLFALRGRAGAGGLRRAAGLAALLAAASAAVALWVGQTQLTQAFFSSPARAWELLAGAWLALQMRRSGWPAWLQRQGAVWAVIGLAAVVASAFTMSHDSVHPGPVTLLPVLGTALLIAGMGARPDAPLARLMGTKPMRAVGARSYSLYLWHWPVMTIGATLPTLGAPGGPGARAGWLLLSVLLAEGAYRFVESPARWRWARGWAAPALLRLALAGSIAVIALGIGLRTSADHGVRAGLLGVTPSRVPGLPLLMETRNDLPVVYAMGCHLGIEPVQPPSHCRLAAGPGKATALLFGDSHAAQWVPALLPVAQARGVALAAWTKSSCPSADVTVWMPATRGVYGECDRWRERVFDQLGELRPQLVLISNFDDATMVLVDRRSGALLRGEAALAEFQAGLERTLRRLRDAGWPVMLIRDTPRPRPDVLDCLYASPRPEPCERGRADALSSSGADLRAAAATGTPVWDFSDAICGAATCPVYMPVERRSVYRDDNHLSASFAASLADAVAARWASLAPARR